MIRWRRLESYLQRGTMVAKCVQVAGEVWAALLHTASGIPHKHGRFLLPTVTCRSLSAGR